MQSPARKGAGDPDALLRATRAGREADPDAVTALVAAFCGRMVEHALRPPPPGLPLVRAFQTRRAEAARAWLQDRAGWS
ncbi:MAG: hypothetical protein ACR2K2_03640 [Mycobacteriales bacterium]